ncbi:polysaccharide pyruvyl transferase family protein [Nocardia sp. NPDC056541]|uniref:polysaccharide pyruvyl transferase family protein n=1 Tax=Nocardia sp. NPDC056541 TaxID=3345860 RepID=UPI00366AABC4
MTKPRIFIYGYHGWKNIGAEARLVSMIENIKARVPDAHITASTSHPKNLDYLTIADERAYVNPALHKRRAAKLIADSDLMILAEGNMLTDEFSPLMVEIFTHAMEEAARQKVLAVGLALDSGTLAPQRHARVASALDGLDLLTVRIDGAAAALKQLGVTRPIEVTADCALSMSPPTPELCEAMAARFGFGSARVHAVAPVDFHMWPAKISLIGRREEYLRWPIKATWADGGREKTAQLLSDWARYVRYLLADRETVVPLVVMDPADRRIVEQLRSELAVPERTPIVDGADLTPHQMSATMFWFDTVTTSRYHALVLPLAHSVPFIALGHDTRTRFIADQFGASDAFIRYDDPQRVEKMIAAHKTVLSDIEQRRTLISEGVRELRQADQRNYDLVAEMLS